MTKLTYTMADILLQTGGSIRYNTIFTVFDNNGKQFGYIELADFLKLQRSFELVKKPRNFISVYDVYTVYKLKGH